MFGLCGLFGGLSAGSAFADSGDSGAATTAAQADATDVNAALPTVTIAYPSSGGIYIVGQAVPTSFTCSEGTGGPGLQSCTDSNGSATGTGQLDTTAAGSYTYTVTATSQDGNVSSTTVDYSVVPPLELVPVISVYVDPSNKFTLTGLHVASSGEVSFKLKLPAAGLVKSLATASQSTFASSSVQVAGARTLVVKLRPNARGARLLEQRRQKLRIDLSVSYTPRGGHPAVKHFYGLRLP